MKPLFHPRLVNGVFGDPVLYVEFQFERRALLFDLGDIYKLSPRKMLRVSHVFVSHTHMDHFIGFDWLLRICLGREKNIRLYGPPDFIRQVKNKLGGYTWNLVQNYQENLLMEVNEFHPDSTLLTTRFSCNRRFEQEAVTQTRVEQGLLLRSPKFSVRAVHLDHKIPSLGFLLEESRHVNVWKNRLEAMKLPTGPWLRELKEAVLEGRRDNEPFRVWWRSEGKEFEKHIPLRELVENLIRIVPGQKVAYVTDVVYHENNKRKIVQLARGADTLFIESTFIHEDEQNARRTNHLTTYQAGCIAREAEVKYVNTFHYSPRYTDQADVVQRQVDDAFSGKVTCE
jgi:ribonuclease Z